MEDTSEIVLIDQTLPAEAVKRIINDIIGSSINILKIERLSNTIRYGSDISKISPNIDALIRIKENPLALINNAIHQGQNLRIEYRAIVSVE